MILRTLPSASAYSDSLQHPSITLIHSALQGLVPHTSASGEPESVCGQSAIVFRMNGPAGTSALRCFTTDPTAAAARYRSLSDFQRSRRPAWLTPAGWYDDAMLVDGETVPCLLMEWVDGRTLDAEVADRIASGRQTELIALADRWRDLVAEMEGAGFAHGDLQHGNVLVDRSGGLRLVDFDGVWLSGAGLSTPNESGHPNYQHPRRITDGLWGEGMDLFAALVIDLSLRALARRPELWRHSGRENLIFTAADLRGPGSTDVWRELATVADHEVQALATQLFKWCSNGTVPVGDLASAIPAPSPQWWTAPPDAAAATDLEVSSGSPSALLSPPIDSDLPWAMTPQRPLIGPSVPDGRDWLSQAPVGEAAAAPPGPRASTAADWAALAGSSPATSTPKATEPTSSWWKRNQWLVVGAIGLCLLIAFGLTRR